MSIRCQLTGTGYLNGNNVSHAKNRTKRRWLPNLQKIKIKIDGVAKRVRVCTSCIKTGKIEKVV